MKGQLRMDNFTLDALVDFITKASIISGAIFGITRYIINKLRTQLTDPLTQSVFSLQQSVSGLHEVVDELRGQIERQEVLQQTSKRRTSLSDREVWNERLRTS